MNIRTMALATAMLAIAAFAPTGAHADCDGVVGVDCTEITGAGKKGSFFRITIPTSPAWNGDLVIMNHGFDLDPASIRPHNTCKNIGGACTVDADCGGGNACAKISYLGVEAGLLPQGVALAASTYSTTGWSAFQSRKDVADILKFIKKDPSIAAPNRVIITGFSMGGAVSIDASLKINPKFIDGIVPLCPAGGGGIPTWDAAHDLRLVYDYVCDGVSGGQFFSASDVGESVSDTTLAVRVDTCLGAIQLSGPQTPEQAAREAEFRTLTGHTGSDFEIVVLMGFATQGMTDLVSDGNKLKGKRFGFNQGISYTVDPGLDAGIERVAAGKGRKKLGKAYNPDYTRGKGKKVAYPIMHLANTDDFLTVPGFQTVFQNALDLGGKAYTSAWVNGGSHCNFSEQEVTATFDTFFAWLDGGPQPTDADVEAACLALPGGIAGDTCDFAIGHVGPPLTDRVPARPDWPAAAQ